MINDRFIFLKKMGILVEIDYFITYMNFDNIFWVFKANKVRNVIQKKITKFKNLLEF